MRATGGVLRVATSLSFAFAVSEGLHWYAARRCLPEAADRSTGSGDDVLLVLGFPSRASGLHPMQKWRTDIAVRSMERSSDILVFSGGSRKKGPCEADDMAAYARDQHQMRSDRLVLEREARSTWQNVGTRSHTLKARGRSRWRRRRCTRRVAVPTWRYNVPIWRGAGGSRCSRLGPESATGAGAAPSRRSSRRCGCLGQL